MKKLIACLTLSSFLFCQTAFANPFFELRRFGGDTFTGPNSITNLGTWLDAVHNPQSTYQDGAVQFTASDKADLSIASNSSLLTGAGVSYELGGWFYFDSLPSSTAVLVGKTASNSTAGFIEYMLTLSTAGKPALVTSTGSVVSTLNWGSNLTTGTWYFIVGSYNSSTNTLTLNVNNGTPVTLGSVADTQSISNAFFVGGYNNAGWWTGRADSVYFTKTISSTSEATALYNAGAGRMYSDLTSANGLGTFQSNLVSWWGFNEENGTRYDAKGTNHLQQTFANIIDNTSTLGTEAVTNGGFNTDTTGWTAGNSATLASVAGGQSGNCLQVTNVGAAFGNAYQAITTVINQNYTLSFYHKNGTTTGSIKVGSTLSGTDYYGVGAQSDSNWTLYTKNFKATTTTTYIQLGMGTNTDGQTTLYDSISVKPLTQTNLNGGFESGGSGETLGSELLLNTGMETAGANPPVIANWALSGNGSVVQNSTAPHSGTYDALITEGVSGSTFIYQRVTTTASTRYKKTIRTKGDGTNTGRYAIYDVTNASNIIATTSTGVSSSTYTLVTVYFTTPAGCVSVELDLFAPAGSTQFAYFDDVSVKQVTASNTFLNWSDESSGSSTVNAGTASPYTGTYNARFDIDSNGSFAGLYQSVITLNHKYKVSFYAKTSSTVGTLKTYIGGGSTATSNTLTTSYVLYTNYGTAASTGSTNLIFETTSSASKSIYLDDVTLACTEIPSAAGIAAGLAIDGNLATSFDGGSSQYLTAANKPSLQTGDVDFTIWGWVNLSSKSSSANQYIIDKYTTSGNLREFYLSYDGADDRFKFNVSSDGSASTPIEDTNLGSPATNTWYFIVAWHDSVNNTINIQTNNGTVVSTAYSSGLTKLTSSFDIGHLSSSASYVYGRIDGVGYIKRVLTTNERASIFNAGKGVKYAGLPATITATTQLVTNGTFSGTTGWTQGSSNATLSASGGKLKVLNTLGSMAFATQALTTVVGRTYSVTYYHQNSDVDGTQGSVGIGTTDSYPDLYNSGNLNDLTLTAYTATFTATSTTTYISLNTDGFGAAGTFTYFSNVSIVDSNLVGFWNLDEYSAGTSNVNRLDSSIFANHLTASGNPPSASGVNYYEGALGKWYDSSINLNNLVQTTQANKLLYVQNGINNLPSLVGDGLTKSAYNAADLIGAGDVTVFAVIKPRGWGPTSATANGRIIDNSKFVLALYQTGSGLVCQSDNNTSATSAASSISLNTAYVVAVTRTSAGVVNFYINGTLSGTANQASGTPVAGTSTYIMNNAAGTRGFDGSVSEVTIYKKILNPSELANENSYLRRKYAI